MANIKSQMKRIKTNEKARQRNKAVKSALKTHIRRFRQAVEAVLDGEGVGHLLHRGAGVGHRAVHAVTAGEQQDAQHVVVAGGG